jgi:hypothetical protein
MLNPKTYSLPKLALACGLAWLSIFAPTSSAKDKNLSAAAQESIQSKMQAQNDTSLYQFDKKGTLTNSYSLPQNVDRYRTLEDLLKSDNATSTCKNPKPTPPPGCVLCDNGQCLCTKFKFKGVE